MHTLNHELIAPGLTGAPCNEAEALGAAVWLWTHSASHRELPLHALHQLLLPAIHHRQFAVVSEGGRPVFYLSWARFDADAEARYLCRSPFDMPDADWTAGDRMWVLDWVAPFGHTRAMSQLVLGRLFPDRCFRALYHRGNDKGLQVRRFHGHALLQAEARAWFAAHPVALPATRPLSACPSRISQ